MIFTVAVEADIKLVERLTFLQEDLGKIAMARGADSRWIRPEHMNIPIVQIGRQEDTEIPEMNHIIERTVPDFEPFRISIAGIHAYPDPTRPRLIHVGIDMGRDKIAALRSGLKNALSEANFGFDPRPYIPSMLLGRIITPDKRIDLTDAITAVKDLNFGGTDICEVALYSANLTLNGTVHQTVSRFALGHARNSIA